MTPVINPWVFYLISTSESLKIVMIILAVVSAFITFLICFQAAYNLIEYGNDDEDYQKYKPFVKPSLIIFCICVLLSVGLPTERTITKMIVAQNVTHERVEVVSDTVETVYNDIMNLFDKSSDSNG